MLQLLFLLPNSMYVLFPTPLYHLSPDALLHFVYLYDMQCILRYTGILCLREIYSSLLLHGDRDLLKHYVATIMGVLPCKSRPVSIATCSRKHQRIIQK